jgi:hypothetical protein
MAEASHASLGSQRHGKMKTPRGGLLTRKAKPWLYGSVRRKYYAKDALLADSAFVASLREALSPLVSVSFNIPLIPAQSNEVRSFLATFLLRPAANHKRDAYRPACLSPPPVLASGVTRRGAAVCRAPGRRSNP